MTYLVGSCFWDRPLGLNVCKNENTVPRTQSFAQLSTPGDPFSISVEGQGEVQEPPGDTVIGFDAAKAVTTGDSLGRPRPSSVLVRVDGRVRGALLRQPQMRERRPQGVRLCNVSDEKTWRCVRQVQSIFCAPTINIKIVLQCFIQPYWVQLEAGRFLKSRNCESRFLLPPAKGIDREGIDSLKGIDSCWWIDSY